MADLIIGKRIHVNGIVQGVGFRPYVYGLAIQNNLTGWVRNTSSGVDIEVNGPPPGIETFLKKLQYFPPPLAIIDSFNVKDCPVNGFLQFEIISSQSSSRDFIPISADISICSDCREELFNPVDRRYRYPFINCTNCGPRFSIIQNIPYDRPFTTMARFDMCDACQEEYQNPSDRRFHAQPIACPKCGPQVSLATHEGKVISIGDEAIQISRGFLQNGKILAIKGLGGYHLACDATNPESINVLRSRKYRSDKPLALMAFDLLRIKKHCVVTEDEAALLESPACPIVILKPRDNTPFADLVSPYQKTLGFMLAYTPLHLLLLEPKIGYPEALVMTSGNLSEEPIAYRDDEAFIKLSRVADAFLVHNRPIHMRMDDSVVRSINKSPYMLRRSRGYAPTPIRLGDEVPEILATGAELKNTFCLSKKNYAFISHHIGDLENYETYLSFSEGIRHFENLFRIKPETIVCDMHPDYLATRYARERVQKERVALLEVQHHHAHMAACLADNQYLNDEPVIGLIFDGSGYGPDHTIWGGEILVGDYQSYKRSYNLKYVCMPGGDLAVKNPSRMALSHLWHANIGWDPDFPIFRDIPDYEMNIIRIQIEKGINSPYTSSMGRLFDAVSAFLGIRPQVNYEGQAAIELEALANPDIQEFYEFSLFEGEIDPSPLWKNIVGDITDGIPISTISAKFHNSVVQLSLRVCKEIQLSQRIQTVALSGGVWQNVFLLEKTIRLLSQNGFDVLIHKNVPANDGGIALGQLMIAADWMKKNPV